MTTGEELRLALNILRKYDLPVSPILEYAIKERLEKLNDTVESKDAISIVSEPLGTTESATVISGGSIQEQFEKYLYSSKSPRTARNYCGLLNKSIRLYINKLVDPSADSVYSFTSVESLKACITKLKANKDFFADNAKWHNALTASLSSYLKFIEQIDKEA